ncbi:hypothetical protein DCAR_0207914 [Daucus carota subsp. sativus]|uniref:Uncharacterized protein n=1 Tax=Daucus carota subsp. sativus TaxID=79200 RepID=A0A161XGR0_DAUCS|nr:PREDICTED: mitochondrial import receptor subunit TOM20 [Daucus carota subsp. sativus]WOG88679.1 hypothetical protein DCAR_0207914 [Daucus carota subsp. sativus]
MEPSPAELERLILYERTRLNAEAHYIKNPNDADNLTRWGGALVEISQFGTLNDSKRMLSDAVSKFEEALVINPSKHDTLWCLGNAFTNQGILTPDIRDAEIYFKKARDCFEKALTESPGNELYRKSLEATDKAPELHMQIQKQMNTGGPPNAKDSEKLNSDLIYDICGWVILVVGIVSWVAMAKSNVPPPHPR